jgi:regulator of RNase E activity RraA
MTIEPGDLIHADQHGVVVIPAEVAPFVADAAREVELSEKPILAACALPNRIEELDKLVAAEY